MAIKKKRPVASVNKPKAKPKPAPYKAASMGGQFLIAWQKANPGMFMPGVSMAQAGTAGVLGSYNPETALAEHQDPAWAVAMLRNMSSRGQGPLAQPAAAAPASGGLQGDGSEVGLSVPNYVASPELEAMRKMAGNRVGVIDQQAQYDQGQVDYRSGIGTGADPGNRFSQTNLLNRAFGRTLTGLETGAASLGQRFSGQYQQQLGDAEFNRGQEQYGIQNQQRDASLGISRQADADKAAVGTGLATAEMSDRASWYDQLRKMATPEDQKS